ncbi:hypothetical protein [Mycolicibacterium mucogenicum]|uniref:Uncharacterized protein n=1 Tax=Mycolicibacterium mucogenicum DSM 44124 TaxID=1226753 RepID=A0A8H2JGT8_MYCMU|nr:hypothetical protein [Mycolicibacterium mucogenicum]KAB7752905.1 hypothetical protein MMUC44124_26670 [Mycolicibacterium mucogenicum DSM 44124]QPG69123.1 hypothetical protein C1S78_027680 [Mycolicibacterium mucogenicum DSM 44124]
MTAGLAAALDMPARSGVHAVLDAANAMTAKVDDLEYRASFAPAVTSGGYCPCGSRFEVRREEITASEPELAAAVAAVADLFGRGPLDDLDKSVVEAVLAAINTERARDDHQALMDWNDAHSYCGVDL